MPTGSYALFYLNLCPSFSIILRPLNAAQAALSDTRIPSVKVLQETPVRLPRSRLLPASPCLPADKYGALGPLRFWLLPAL